MTSTIFFVSSINATTQHWQKTLLKMMSKMKTNACLFCLWNTCVWLWQRRLCFYKAFIAIALVRWMNCNLCNQPRWHQLPKWQCFEWQHCWPPGDQEWHHSQLCSCGDRSHNANVWTLKKCNIHFSLMAWVWEGSHVLGCVAALLCLLAPINLQVPRCGFLPDFLPVPWCT